MGAESTWWYWRPIQERLIAFGQALLAPLGRRYRITLRPGQSFCSPERGLIQLDPASFPDESPGVQFQATEGVMVHEAGHALFSAAWPEQQEDVLRDLVNLVEDERVERAMRRLYPGVAGVLDLRCRLRLAQAVRAEREAPPEWQAFNAALVWRWAKRCRMSQKKMLAALKCGAPGARLWRQIRPLVEQGWEEGDTAAVIELARRILGILGIPPETARPSMALLSQESGDIPRQRSDPPLATPAGAALSRQPAPPEAGDDVDLEPGADAYLQPEPYQALEDEARPLAGQLAEALRLPEPELRPRPDEWRGRYSFRQEVRTPDMPCLHFVEPGRAARSLALYVLVDRSGSMDDAEPEVRLALMTLYLAATQLRIPIGIAAFGADSDDDEAALTFPIAPLSPAATEAAKALIAGYRGETSAEYLDWGLRLAEAELAVRPERRKFIVVTHDGQPVYSGARGDDWELSLAHLAHLEARDIIPIGVYLGQDSGDIEKLNRLFPRLIVTAPQQLPERLGDVLRALAQ